IASRTTDRALVRYLYPAGASLAESNPSIAPAMASSVTTAPIIRAAIRPSSTSASLRVRSPGRIRAPASRNPAPPAMKIAVVSRGNGQAAGVRSLVPPLRIAERGKGGEVSRAVTTYARRLGLFSGTMAVIGGIIGAGIFRSPPVVAQRVGTAGLTLAAWGLGGVIALAGGLCFGELGARKPQAGGGYVYLRDAFGPLPAFLYGWALLLVIATGAIGAVAVTFATYVLALAGLSDRLTIPVAVGAIAFLTGINYVGVKPAAVTQNIFTVLKLAALAALIA